MNIVKAREILNTEEYSNAPREHQCAILEGMKKIASNTADNCIGSHAEHDQFWYGDFDSTISKMNEDCVKYLYFLGWFEDDEMWSIFV